MASPMFGTRSRYSYVSIVLHWGMALLLVGMIALGWSMEDLEPGEAEGLGVVLLQMGLTKFSAIQLHKSLGITLLLLTGVRLLARLLTSAPALPAGMKAWERLAARLTHLGFYLLMVGIPMSGWAMVSTSKWNGVPTLLFGQVAWPHLPGLVSLTGDAKAWVNDAAESAHSAGVWVLIALMALHVLAALKHQYIDRDNLIARMLPVIR